LLFDFFFYCFKKEKSRGIVLNSRTKKIIVAIVIIAGIGIFGYTQYLSVSEISAVITSSTPVNADDENNSEFNLEIEFENPSILPLSAGETEFMLTVDKKRIGDGTLEPFTLPSMSKTLAKGTFVVYDDETDSTSAVKISGFTKYDLFFTTIDVPFVYYPSMSQTREFINRN
jgi:hypothetical protein